LHWLLLLITLFVAKKCICFNSHCLPWLLWFHLILLNLFCVILNVGRDDDFICLHFVFKCKIINNALILGELSYIFYNILLGLISIGIGYCCKTNLFFLILSVWYVSNVSIIFDAPCMFVHHLLWVLLHFVAFLCIF
jgi:hypothetical protein